MEENKSPNTVQATSGPSQSGMDNQKGGKNIFMLLVLLGLLVIFGLLVYAVNMNNEANYVSQIKPANLLNPSKSVDTSDTSFTERQVEGVDSVDVGDIDTDLQDLSSDVQGL